MKLFKPKKMIHYIRTHHMKVNLFNLKKNYNKKKI
jgi:hypothetical protein